MTATLSFAHEEQGGSGGSSGGGGNSAAVITGEFSDGCRDFTATSTKDISHVEIHYADGRVVKDDKVNSPTYHTESDDDADKIDHVYVKSGTTTERFDCQPPCPEGQVRDENGHCVPGPCPEGQVRDENGHCVPGPCPEGQVRDENGHCVPAPCPEGQERVNGHCVPKCPAGHTRNAAGECVPGAGNRFTCRASALRIDGSPLAPLIGDPFEPFVANAAGDPCADDDASLINTGDQIAGPPGTLTVKVAHATTSNDNGADAEAGVASVVITDSLGLQVVKVGILNSTASGRCSGGQPVLSSASEVATLFVGPASLAITIPPDDPATPTDESAVDVPLGPLGTVHLNWEEKSQVKVTRRALFFEGSPLGDIIVGEAIADVHGNPC